MARVPLHGVFTDGEGKIVVGGVATAYEYNSSDPAAPNTLATIYDAQSGGSAISGSVMTTDSNGAYLGWIDDADYAGNQAFTIILSKGGYQDNPWHFSLPGLSYASAVETLINKTLTSPVLTTPQINDTSLDHQYIISPAELAADRTLSLPLMTGNDTIALLALAQTFTNKTLTSPKIGTSVLDTNGLQLMLLTATASAVNEITLANASTGNNPTITASGDDTNIGINFVPKGTGNIQIGGVQVPVTTDLYHFRTGLVCKRATTTTITVSAGEIMVDGTPIRKQTDTTLALTAAGDWVDNTSDRAADTAGYIYINNAGTIELDDAAPDASDSSDNTSGLLRYNNTGTDTSWRRCIGKFQMNGSQELSENAVWTFGEAVPGSWDLIQAQTASADASVDFTSGFTNAYSKFKIEFTDVLPASDVQHLYCRISASSSFHSAASDYQWAYDGSTGPSPGLGSGSQADSEINITVSTAGTAGGETVSGFMEIYNMLSTTIKTEVLWKYTGKTSGASTIIGHGGGELIIAAEANDGIQFLFASGNITSGEFRLYGLGQ